MLITPAINAIIYIMQKENIEQKHEYYVEMQFAYQLTIFLFLDKFVANKNTFKNIGLFNVR